jgi:hypothetical protein
MMMTSKRGVVVAGAERQLNFQRLAAGLVAASFLMALSGIAVAQVSPCTQNCASLSVGDATIPAGGTGEVTVTFNQGSSNGQSGGPDEIAAIAFTLQLSDAVTLANCTLDADGLPGAVEKGPNLGNFRVVVENASCTAGKNHCLCGTATPDAFVNIAVYGPNPLPAPGSGPVQIPTIPSGTLLTINLAVESGTPNGVIPLHVVNETADSSKPQFQAFLSVGDKDAVDQTCVPQTGTPPCSGSGATSQVAIDDGEITVAGEICVGDCDGGNTVTVDELVRMVNIALGRQQDLVLCPNADGNGDMLVTVDEIVTAVNNALNGCGS